MFVRKVLCKLIHHVKLTSSLINIEIPAGNRLCTESISVAAFCKLTVHRNLR